MSDGKITLISEGALNTIEISMPSFPYKTIIEYPYDIQKLDNGQYDIWDNGSAYDKRKCRCLFILSPTEQQTLNNFLRDDNIAVSRGRAYDITMSMDADSGFFPFGPDKGDTGDFTVAIIIRKSDAIGEEPFKYFKSELEIINVGSYPSYNLPSQIAEGNLTIGTITNNRFPPDWFEPEVKYQYTATRRENGAVSWIDRGEMGDWYETTLKMRSNESKTAAIINYLNTIRTANFNIIAPADMYMFGRDIGNGTIEVKLIQNAIEITHQKYNMYDYELNVTYINGPA